MRQWSLLIGLLLAVIFWIIAWHGDAAARMARTWWESDTFAHGLIIYPVSAWLIWRRRAELAGLPVQPCFWALAPLLGAAFIALLGTLGGVEAAKQFGLVAMIALSVVVVFGLPLARAIAFPLAFTLLAVPVGDFLLPTLMQHTADFTVAALRLTGIPVYREGLFFTLPSGRWSVVEACSGLRYLIASVTLGLLYAYLTYKTLWRRALFVLASILLPIVANWLRAYMIVMIGHLSGMRLAVGIDHLIYGWVFFGVVMLALFWVGSWWREDRVASAAPRSETRGTGAGPNFGVVAAAFGVAIVSSLGPLYVGILDANAGMPQRVLAPPVATGDWAMASSRLPQFTPHFRNARSMIHQSYERAGMQVGVFVAYYARQSDGNELISFGNDLVTSSDHSWARLSERRRSSASLGHDVLEAHLRSDRGSQLVAWRWYWTGGQWSIAPEQIKLRQAFARLVGRDDDAAVVVVYAMPSASTNEEPEILERFLGAMAPSIRQALEAARGSTVHPTAAGDR